MPASLVRLENFDMDNSKDEIQDKKDCCDGHIRYD
jgi:hypothetical protein